MSRTRWRWADSRRKCNPRASVVHRAPITRPRNPPAPLGRDALAGMLLFVSGAREYGRVTLSSSWLGVAVFFFYYFLSFFSHAVRSMRRSAPLRFVSRALRTSFRTLAFDFLPLCFFLPVYLTRPYRPLIFLLPFLSSSNSFSFAITPFMFATASRFCAASRARGAVNLTSLFNTVFPIITRMFTN